MKRPKERLELDENGNLKKKGFFSWIANYGYYYKSYIIVFGVILLFGVGMYFSIRGAKADMYLYLVTSEHTTLSDEQVNAFFDNAKGYVEDFDNDGTAYFLPKWLRLPDDRTDIAYNDLERTLKDPNVVCFAADEYACEILMGKQALRELSFFGLEGDDEYRILLNDTGYMKGVNAEEPVYLVMKYFSEDQYEDYFISLLTTSVVDIAHKLQDN